MMRCCPSPWHSPDPILSPHHLRCQYTPYLHNCNSLIWNFCLDNIRACVSRAQGLHCHWQLALRGEVWISIECQWSVTGSYQPHNPDHNTQYKSNTCRILSNKSNSHELCFFFQYIFKHGILLCWTYSHPSENMTNAENHSVNFPLVAFNDPYDQYYIISQTRGGLLRLHNWVFMQNKLYSQSQHYVPWWNVTPLTFKWLERLTDKMLLPLTGAREGEM